MAKFEVGDYIYMENCNDGEPYGKITKIEQDRICGYWAESIDKIRNTNYGTLPTDWESIRLIKYMNSPLWKKLEGIK